MKWTLYSSMEKITLDLTPHGLRERVAFKKPRNLFPRVVLFWWTIHGGIQKSEIYPKQRI